MFVITMSVKEILAIAAILFLAGCFLASVIGTRMARRKQKQEVRRWRLERKPPETKTGDK